jgi:hypothetical protein
MANKKGPLSKAETFYIDQHVKAGKDIHEIATDLDRAISSIEKRVTKIKKENSKPATAGQQFARQSGVTIMTENASTMGDARRRSKKPSKMGECVTKIKNDE